MTINEIIKDAERLLFADSEGLAPGEEWRVMLFIYDKDKAEDDYIIIESFKDDLSALIAGIQEYDKKVRAAADILSLLFKYLEANQTYISFTDHSHHINNFNKPEREYNRRIKAAEEILGSMSSFNDPTVKEVELKTLLQEYIEQQKHYLNDGKKGALNVRSAVWVDTVFNSAYTPKLRKFTKQEFEKRLREILKQYDVTLHLRPIIDNLKETGYLLE